jgi:acyl carrier protein
MTTKAEPAQVEKVIFDGLAEVGAEPGEIKREAEFEALDVDSLDLVELAQIVEEEFGVRLEGDDLKGLTTVGDVIDLVAKRAG